MSYGLEPNFPSEAHQIERMMPVIFSANYKVNPWMNNEIEFDKKIEAERLITIENDAKRNRGQLRKFIDRILEK